MSKLWAKVQFRFEGLHHYPAAPEEVAFLRDLHRHEFHCTVWLQQFHDDRDIEYLLFKRDLVAQACKRMQEAMPTTASCEWMAKWIAVWVLEHYPKPVPAFGLHRSIRVEVTEDGENGALFETD